MQNGTYDVIVVGVGGMGSAALYELAKRGQRVLGIERYGIAHDMGSSHGFTRIIRLAYYEDPSYVPLLRRAYELWRELQEVMGEQVLHITGSIDAGPPGSFTFDGSLESCLMHGIPHEVLTSAEISSRFPGYRLPSETMAVYQEDGGFLVPEKCIEGYVELAKGLGAEVHTDERVLDWSATSSGVQVTTATGKYEAERLVVTAGAWTESMLPALKGLAVPERQVLAWFEPKRPEHYQPATFPVFNVVVDEGRYYGFPEFGVPGFKVGRYHHMEEVVDPDAYDREPNLHDEVLLREFTENYFPDAAGATLSMKACMFTNSPDEHFIIDTLDPSQSNVVIAAGFSGHGFKFCSVVGEVLADLSLSGSTRHDIAMFRLGRFAP
ncbi:MAG: N-methyl-L-tryptophan oxidase [Chloroflexi bacterium]|nr:N-methyl-L-tryptophan oxidase [Chloroflexota bacterium]